METKSTLYNEFPLFLKRYFSYKVQKISLNAGFWLVAGEAQITRVAVAAGEREHGLGTRLTAALINKAWEATAAT